MGIIKNTILENRDSFKNHILSANIKADSFICGLYDEDFVLHTVIEYSDISEEDVTSVVNDIRTFSARHISVAYSDKPFLHTPLKDDQITEYIPYYQNKIKYSDLLTGYDVFTNYALNTTSYKIWSSIDDVKITHLSNVLAHDLYPNVDKKLSAYLETNAIHLTYVTDDNFVFYNQYYCETKEDFLYYILNAYKVLNLNLNKNILCVSGFIHPEGELYNLLYDYIETIIFPIESGSVVGSKKIEPSQFFDLYNIARCVS